MNGRRSQYFEFLLENDNLEMPDLYQNLLRGEENNSSRIVSSPEFCVNTLPSRNNSNQDESINTLAVLYSQDQDILKTLKELQSAEEDENTLHNNINSNCIYEPSIEG